MKCTIIERLVCFELFNCSVTGAIFRPKFYRQIKEDMRRRVEKFYRTKNFFLEDEKFSSL